jgi:hypothetical protein
MLISLAALVILLYFSGDYPSSLSWLKFVFIMLLIPMALIYIRRNKSGTFSAEDIPIKLSAQD